MKHTKEMLLIKVEDLVPSSFNVRRYSAGQVEELAALIASQGLLQNLIVTEQVVGRGKRQETKFGVVAGERRRRALALLQQRKELAAGHEVLCELVSAERAFEASLGENSGREAMHPADEFEAFHALVRQGRGVEDVAARFGVSPLVVQRRLKLAALSPKLLTLYRDDGVDLDQLMALCLSGDHAVQERAWFDAHPWERSAAALRKRLTQGEVLAHQSALARYVGIEAYEAAGGFVRRDLFDSDNECWICDLVLLRRLAGEKLEKEAEQAQGEGWVWVEARIEFDAAARRDFLRCEPTLRSPTPDEKRLLAELDQRAEELEAEQRALDDNDTWTQADGERIDLEEQDIESRRRAIQVARQVWRADDKAGAGAVVTVGRDGSSEWVRGLVRPGDRRNDGGGARSSGERGRADAAMDVSMPAAEPSDSGRGFSETLLRRLAAHRTAALQAVVAQDTGTALVALTHALTLQVFERNGCEARSALQISARPPRHELLRAADDLPAARAWQTLEARRVAWLERLPQAETEWLDWLAELPQTELNDLLGLCSASLTLVPVGPVSAARTLERLSGLDMRTWWESTPESYLKHVSKAQIVEAMKEGGAGVEASSAQGMKKDELASFAAVRLAGSGWLPEPLRVAAAT